MSRKQFLLFGNLRKIISDCGIAFTSNAFKEYFDEEKVGHFIATGS